jgi:hypothetical protein
MQSRLFRNGTELLKEAKTKRFELEERGWKPIETAPARTVS